MVPQVQTPSVQSSALLPASLQDRQLLAGEPATAQALTLIVPTQRERPLPYCSQQPVQVAGSRWQ